MEQTYTWKTKRHAGNSMNDPKHHLRHGKDEIAFERKIFSLLDKQLISPRDRVIERILNFSKETL